MCVHACVCVSVCACLFARYLSGVSVSHLPSNIPVCLCARMAAYTECCIVSKSAKSLCCPSQHTHTHTHAHTYSVFHNIFSFSTNLNILLRVWTEFGSRITTQWGSRWGQWGSQLDLSSCWPAKRAPDFKATWWCFWLGLHGRGSS